VRSGVDRRADGGTHYWPLTRYCHSHEGTTVQVQHVLIDVW